MLRGLGLGFENIYECLNDCVLFYKEHEKNDKCSVYTEPRHKHSICKQRKRLPKKCRITKLPYGLG